jgi:hypothetical protein
MVEECPSYNLHQIFLRVCVEETRIFVIYAIVWFFFVLFFLDTSDISFNEMSGMRV